VIIPGGKTSAFKKLLILELILFEVFVLIVMEIYKYYNNLYISNIFSKDFIRSFFRNYDFFYTGTLLWLIAGILAIFAIFNIYFHISKVSESSLKILVLFSFILLALLFTAIFIPSTESFDEFTVKIIQLNAKGTKIVGLSLFALLHIFMIVSIVLISFSALKKYYVFRSIWLTILTFLLGFGLVLLTIYNYSDDSDLLTVEKQKADAGVVLGAAVWGGNRPSPVLRERINKGFELYKSGIIKYIVLTGGGAPGEMTEAEVAKNELIKKGVDDKFIFIENKSNSTLEQITYINQNLYKKNNWRNIILITDNFHLMRSSQICKFFGISCMTAASDTPLSTESTFSYSVKESFAVILFWLFGIG
jgi:uncharacterized SAM-binding protein YcdF (DUF218 family)